MIRQRPPPSRRLPDDILKLMKERDKVRKYYQKYQNARDRDRMNELSREIGRRSG